MQSISGDEAQFLLNQWQSQTAWTLGDAGFAKNSPEDFGIARRIRTPAGCPARRGATHRTASANVPRGEAPRRITHMKPTPKRRPGESPFNAAILVANFYLLYTAHSIAGFKALSSRGAVPMAITAIMVVTSAIMLRQTCRKGSGTTQTLRHDILPAAVLMTTAMVGACAVALRRLGFLPTSVVFLLVMIRFLSRRSWSFCLAVSVGTVILI
ncbi:tripartite tricarboxylate transporter TctB family protein [Paracoccus sp. R86501]|uniref:tripartite tricarboxylate transporter TctB family protein n=1 Tax=Paracoccus sp. R86501 TaxID=3101711 RepID=UPI003670EADD